LVDLVNEIAWEENRKLEGTEVEILVAEGEGRKDEATARVSGRARDNRLVHVAVAENEPPEPGDLVSARVTYAAPHHLVADEVLDIQRRGLSGDGKPTVGLGMPSIGRPSV